MSEQELQQLYEKNMQQPFFKINGCISFEDWKKQQLNLQKQQTSLKPWTRLNEVNSQLIKDLKRKELIAKNALYAKKGRKLIQRGQKGLIPQITNLISTDKKKTSTWINSIVQNNK